ncbi:MAG TPA: ABC transporter ATP-binding protein [Acidimicrobiia bacterium]|jgi:branched-chain amino acid transport system ATP-binding protein|nr:ABC transporter ATP-binding protein [Acidimicrobiia bacterium]
MKLDVADLSVRFGGLRALNNVSLSVPDGAVVGLIGPNGAGKTTLFNAISGFVRTESGRVTFGERDITHLAPHRRAGLGLVRTFQHGGLVPQATVVDNIVMAQHATMRTGVLAGILGRATAEERQLRERAGDVLARLALEAVAGKPVHDLSHGLIKMVELACALVRDPQALLLDEPSAGLDPAETADLGARLRALHEERGVTTLVIDHDLRLVRHVARHIVVLSFGEVIAEGDWEVVRRDPKVIAAYLGPQSTDATTPTVDLTQEDDPDVAARTV